MVEKKMKENTTKRACLCEKNLSTGMENSNSIYISFVEAFLSATQFFPKRSGITNKTENLSILIATHSATHFF